MQRLLKNKLLLAFIVILLIGLNYLQWGSEDTSIATSDTSGTENQSDVNFNELKLAVISSSDKPEVKRDLFYPKIVKPKPKPKVVKVKPVEKPKGPPPLTPEQIAQKKARLQLEKVQLMGIMEEDGLRKAFIMYEDSSYIVKQGEEFAQVFRLSRINPNRVDVTETNTTLSRTIDITK